MQPLYTDTQAHKFPISVKGIIRYDDRYLLKKNERNEWELPGGKLEKHEEPVICVTRELKEETGIDVKVGHLIDAWIYNLGKNVSVLILTYECIAKNLTLPIHSPEGAELGWFDIANIEKLRIPNGYKKSIRMYELSKILR